MPKRIEKLTPEQEAQMAPWAKKWIEIGLRTGETDWDTFDKYMPICFKEAGLEYPKRVIRVSSPLVGALASSIAGRILNDGAVHGAVRGAVHGAVGDAVHGAVGDAVHGAVRGAVHGAVRGAVHGAVGDAVHGAVYGAKLNWHYWLGGQFWVGWYWYGSPAVVSFFTEVCGLELDKDIQERAEAYQKVCESVNHIWPNKDFVMVCARPSYIGRDARGRLHSEEGMAIRYPDGWGLYVLNGVRMEQELHEKIVGKKLSFAEIMALKNIEHRMIALKYMNFGELMRGAGGKLVDKSSAKGNELWLLDNKDIFPRSEYFLHYECPSTGREYSKCVEREWALLPDGNLSADKAQSQSHHFTLDEYLKLEIEA